MRKPFNQKAKNADVLVWITWNTQCWTTTTSLSNRYLGKQGLRYLVASA